MAIPHIEALAGVALLLAFSGCDRPKPKLSDQTVQRLRDALPGITEQCLRKMRFGGIEAAPAHTDECFEMEPKRRWRGLWRDDFEGSRFCPFPARQCSEKAPGDEIWLTFSDSILRTWEASNGQLYAVEFDGRRTLRRGNYVGMSKYEMIVDNLISIKAVEGDHR